MKNNNFNKNVTILGQEYEINFDLNDNENDGITYVYDKIISVMPAYKFLDENASNASKEKAFKETLRHELFHALFFESGLSEYCFDENLIEFLAIQTPKIFKIFSELNILN